MDQYESPPPPTPPPRAPVREQLEYLHKNIASLMLKYTSFIIVFKRDNHVTNIFFCKSSENVSSYEEIAKTMYSLHLNNTYIDA